MVMRRSVLRVHSAATSRADVRLQRVLAQCVPFAATSGGATVRLAAKPLAVSNAAGASSGSERRFTTSTASRKKGASNIGLRRFADPAAMHQDMIAVTAEPGSVVRNYCGVIERMDPKSLVIETELFPRAALQFYTRYNLNLTTAADNEAHAKYYNAARGGTQGDYRKDINAKIANVVDSLTRFPESKRGVLTIPAQASLDHTNDGDAKCLRELHFYLEASNGRDLDTLSCSGFMRAQAASIFPKNIHFIGTIMNDIAAKLQKRVGTYTHFVTAFTSGRE